MGLLKHIETLQARSNLPQDLISGSVSHASYQSVPSVSMRLNMPWAVLFPFGNRYCISHQDFFDIESIFKSVSSADFWNGILKTKKEWQFFTGKELSPFYQLFSDRMKNNLTQLYVKSFVILSDIPVTAIMIVLPEHYADFPETSTFSAELKENLEYSISPQTDDKLEINSTILSITAKLSDELLLNPDTDYKTTDMYFKKHGYVVNLSGEKVLRNIVMPINFEQVDHQLILDTLKDRLSEEPITVGEINYYFERVGSVQQLKDQKEGKAFEYIVMAEYSDANGQPAYFRLNVKMVYFNSKIIILSYNNQEAGTVSSEYFAKPYNNANMLIVASEQSASETPDQNQGNNTTKE